MPRLPDRAAAAARGGSAALHRRAGRVPRLRGSGAQAIALSFAHLAAGGGDVRAVRARVRHHLSMPAWMLIMVAANLISAVPITPSNIGAYEVAITELLKALGVEAGAAGGLRDRRARLQHPLDHGGRGSPRCGRLASASTTCSRSGRRSESCRRRTTVGTSSKLDVRARTSRHPSTGRTCARRRGTTPRRTKAEALVELRPTPRSGG